MAAKTEKSKKRKRASFSPMKKKSENEGAKGSVEKEKELVTHHEPQEKTDTAAPFITATESDEETASADATEEASVSEEHIDELEVSSTDDNVTEELERMLKKHDIPRHESAAATSDNEDKKEHDTSSKKSDEDTTVDEEIEKSKHDSPKKSSEHKEDSTASDFAPLEGIEGTDLDVAESKSHKNIVLLVVIAVGSFLFGLTVSFVVGKVFMGHKDTIVLATPTPVAEASPTPTPEPAINREEITMEILNGSGVKGAAAKAQKFFEDLGYTVDSIGNADASNYDKSELVVKSDTDEVVTKLLLDDIGDTYNVSSTSADLSNSSKFSARFIVGKE